MPKKRLTSRPIEGVDPPSNPGSIRIADTPREKAGKFLGRLGTELAITPFQFRKPTESEYAVGESGTFAQKMGMVSNSAAIGLIDLMTEKVGGKVLGRAGKFINDLRAPKARIQPDALLDAGRVYSDAPDIRLAAQEPLPTTEVGPRVGRAPRQPGPYRLNQAERLDRLEALQQADNRAGYTPEQYRAAVDELYQREANIETPTSLFDYQTPDISQIDFTNLTLSRKERAKSLINNRPVVDQGDVQRAVADAPARTPEVDPQMIADRDILENRRGSLVDIGEGRARSVNPNLADEFDPTDIPPAPPAPDSPGGIRRTNRQATTLANDLNRIGLTTDDVADLNMTPQVAERFQRNAVSLVDRGAELQDTGQWLLRAEREGVDPIDLFNKEGIQETTWDAFKQGGFPTSDKQQVFKFSDRPDRKIIVDNRATATGSKGRIQMSESGSKLFFDTQDMGDMNLVTNLGFFANTGGGGTRLSAARMAKDFEDMLPANSVLYEADISTDSLPFLFNMIKRGNAKTPGKYIIETAEKGLKGRQYSYSRQTVNDLGKFSQMSNASVEQQAKMFNKIMQQMEKESGETIGRATITGVEGSTTRTLQIPSFTIKKVLPAFVGVTGGLSLYNTGKNEK